MSKNIEHSLNSPFIADEEDDDADVSDRPFNLSDVLQDFAKGQSGNDGYQIKQLPFAYDQQNLQQPVSNYQSSTAPNLTLKKDKSTNRKPGTVHFQDKNQVIIEDNNENHESPRNSKQQEDQSTKISKKSSKKGSEFVYDDQESTEKNNVLNVNEDNFEVNYGKGETPLDLFLEGTYEDGKKTTLDPLTVFRPKLKPKIQDLKNGQQTYVHFDEKSYYKTDVLRSIDQKDGFLGYYSMPWTKKNQTLKMLVCVTMYSEERVFLEQTLYHIFKNMSGFEDIGLKDFQIVVVVIQDGIMKMKEEVVDFYCDLEGENINVDRNLKLRRYEIAKQEQFLQYKGQQKVLDSNEGLPLTIPKRTALVYQNRLQFVKDNYLKKEERPKVYSSNHYQYDTKKPGLTVFSVFKHKNAKKLSSHMWFFEGFCRQFRPKYCALVDVGTFPASDGLLKFYIAMEGNPKVGGVCGFLGLEDPPEYEEQLEEAETPHMMELNRILDEKKKNLDKWQKDFEEKKLKDRQKQEQKNREQDQVFINKELEERKKQHFESKHRTHRFFQYTIFLPIMLLQIGIGLVYWIIRKAIFKWIFRLFRWFAVNYLEIFASLKKAQLYEYTMAHMVDKNFESLLGFLHVLPGAWSAYRYEALEVKFSNRQNLLQRKYFKQLVNPDKLEGNIKEANMFLAEDRILCLGIYCQPDSNFTLKFIPDAKAFTDPVGTLEEFMNQRRRWINSTMFALDYVLKHYSFHVQESSHSSTEKGFLLPFNMLFAKIGDINSYFIPAFYLFVVLMSSFQLLSPDIQKGYSYVPFEGETVKFECLVGKKIEDYESECDYDTGISEGCYQKCESTSYPKAFYVALNLVPFIYIVCFLLIVFASLTFKVRRLAQNAYENLRRMILSDEQKTDIKEMEDNIKNLEVSMSRLQENKDIQKQKKEIKKEKRRVRVEIFKVTQTTYEMLVAKIREHHIKLSPSEKKFKIEYDKIISQEYANDIFKILAAVMSVMSIIIMLIVSLAIAMNIFNSGFGIINGFVKLDGWLRLYIIIMVVINMGSFFGILFVHLFIQPKLVWYIFISYWSYIVYQPIYNFILIIFSFCNIDDVTWGTKGLSDSKEANSYYQEKVKFLVRWFASNIILLLALIGGNVFTGKTPYIILFIGLYGTAYLAIKTILAIINYIKYFIFNKIYYKYQIRKTKKKNEDSQKNLKKEYNRFISTMENNRQRSVSRYDYPIYQQNPSISGSMYQENLIFHSKFNRVSNFQGVGSSSNVTVNANQLNNQQPQHPNIVQNQSPHPPQQAQK
ncbi:hypothetical protein ABPG72_002950 [Tetrahymena utriculariae]